MARHFTVAEAQALIPAVERLLREAIELKEAYQAGEQEIQSFQQRVMAMGGMIPDRDRALDARRRRDEAGAKLRAAVEGLLETGCVIKDLDVGLIDFPTVYRGNEVYLCWKLGESSIGFWHGDEGFRGRKAIDQDFLDHHEGSSDE